MLYLFAEMYLWLIAAALLGGATGWWIWGRGGRLRQQKLADELETARRSLDDMATARARVERDLASTRDQIPALALEVDRLKAELAKARGEEAAYAERKAKIAADSEEKLPLFLDSPRGEPDNLRLIKGIGDKLYVLLSSLGIYHFRQIAQWNPDDVVAVDAKLGPFQGRITRDQWVEQARLLAADRTEEFEARYGKIGG